MDQTLYRVATRKREEIKGMAKQKTADDNEGGNHLGQDNIEQKTMEGIDEGLNPVVDGQSESENRVKYNQGNRVLTVIHKTEIFFPSSHSGISHPFPAITLLYATLQKPSCGSMHERDSCWW